MKIEVAEFEILDLDPAELAEQLTLIDHDLLKEITPSEFLHKNFDNPKLSSAFTSMVNKFNEVSQDPPMKYAYCCQASISLSVVDSLGCH